MAGTADMADMAEADTAAGIIDRSSVPWQTLPDPTKRRISSAPRDHARAGAKTHLDPCLRTKLIKFEYAEGIAVSVATSE